MTPRAGPPEHRHAALVGPVAALGGAWAVVVGVGRWLPLPSRSSLADPLAWAARDGAVQLAFTAVRAVAIGLLTWITATVLLGALARALRLARAVHALDRLSLPMARRLAELAVGLCVVVGSLAPSPVRADGAPPSTPPPTMQDLGPAGGPGTPTSTASAAPATPDPSALAPGRGSPAPEEPAPTDTPAEPGERDANDPEPAGTVPGTWVVAPGDTLWHVAEVSVGLELGRPAAPAEVLEGLRLLVAANADRLVIPGDPDLILPGQELVVPSPLSAAAPPPRWPAGDPRP